MEYLIDFLTVTIKTDKKASNPYKLELDEVLKIFGLWNEINNFTFIGSRCFYDYCFTYKGMDFRFTSPERIENQGYCLYLTGQGCRYFESIQPDGFTWKSFFEKLYSYVQKGCKVNIARIDFAFDDIVKEDDKDKKPLLNLDVINSHRENSLFVSIYRKSESKGNDEFLFKTSIDETLRSRKRSKTIYFGSRKSNSFCRIYDKNVEQLQKLKSNPVELKEYQDKKINHWVRFEIVFKNKVAIKIINSMIRLKEEMFVKELAKIINGNISFINPDNDNRYRCSIADWWAEFLGTVEKAKLKSIGLIKNPLKRAVEWVMRSVAPTLQAVKYSISTEKLLKLIDDFAPVSRFKKRHFEIANTTNFEENSYSDYDYWKSLIPIFVDDVNKNNGFEYVEGFGLCEVIS